MGSAVQIQNFGKRCLVIEFLRRMPDFLGQVESAISDPVRLKASVAEIRCVFLQLPTHGAEILLGKLAVGGITQTKTKTDILTWNTHLKA